MEKNCITVKAYRYTSQTEDVAEIRRLSISKHLLYRPDSITIFAQTLDKMFKDSSEFASSHLMFWKDEEEDLIRIQSSEELGHAVQNRKTEVFKIHLKPAPGGQMKDKTGSSAKKDLNSEDCSGNESPTQKELHKFVICDGCEGKVNGYRFKCLECHDYDLCEACFQVDKHPSHMMIRLVRPDATHHWRNVVGSMFGPRFPHHGRRFGPCHRGGFGRRRGGYRGCGLPCDPKQPSQDKTEEKATSQESDSKMWNDYLKEWGQTVSNLLDQFGIDAMVDLEYPNGETHSVDKTPKEKDTPSPSEKSSDDMGQSGTTNASDDDQQKCAGEFSSTEERHCNAETCNDVKDQESAAAENPECKEEVSGACGSDEELSDAIKAEWTVVEKVEPLAETSPDVRGVDNVPNNESPNVKIATEMEKKVIFLEEMGFKNHGMKLHELLEMTGGNVGAVLDMLK